MLKENIINCTCTVWHYSLVNLKGVLKPSLGLVLIDPESSFTFYHLESCSSWLLVEWNDRSELRAAEGRPHPVHQLSANQSPLFGHSISLDQCRPVIPVHHLGPRHDNVNGHSGRHDERGRGEDNGQHIPVALFPETVLNRRYILMKAWHKMKSFTNTSWQGPHSHRGRTVSRSEITSRKEETVRLLHLSLRKFVKKWLGPGSGPFLVHSNSFHSLLSPYLNHSLLIEFLVKVRLH